MASTPSIAFGIPTWNRSARLKVLLENLVGQIQQCGQKVEIFVSDNCSSDDTEQTVRAFMRDHDYIHYHRRSEHGDYADNFREAANLVTSEYLWFFGDDDILLPGTLATALDVMRLYPVDFYHCSFAEGEIVDRPMRMVKGQLLRLCEELGWLNMIGQISCCIIRADKFRAGFQSVDMDVYRQTSFVHSCAALDQMADSDAVIIDKPMVTSQDKNQSAETQARWKQENIVSRYFLIGQALEAMGRRGVIPLKLKKRFLRMGAGHLWDFCLRSLVRDYLLAPREVSRTMWNLVENFAVLLENPQDVQELRNLSQRSWDAVSRHRQAVTGGASSQRVEELVAELNAIYAFHCQTFYHTLLSSDGL